MTETAVADFVARFAVDPVGGLDGRPSDCRVVMSRRQLVVASDDDRHAIPLSDVVDVVVGNVPADLRGMFDDTVTVGYETDDGGVRTLLIEAESERISRFVDVLFGCLLDGTEALVRHPARVGGRVTDTEAVPAELSVEETALEVTTPEDVFTVDVTSVVDFDRGKKKLAGGERPTLVIKHTDGSDVVTSLVAPQSSRHANLLGRYVRLEYGDVRRELSDVELSTPEKQMLVTVYATGGDVDFTQVLEGDAARATNVLNTLREKGLIDEGENSIRLTPEGRIVVTERLEDVNV